MSTIVFEGNTYTFGATVSANPGTGTTSYVFGGLNAGQTYGFIIWAFNGFGNSNIVGPANITTLPQLLPESREMVSAFAYSWGLTDSFPVLRYSTGSTLNMFYDSETISSTWWGVGGATRTPSGVTLPNGRNNGIILTNPIGAATFNQFPQLLGGNTYVYSFYLNESLGSGGIQAALYFVDGSRGILRRQILPLESAWTSSGAFQTLLRDSGLSGWVRYAFELYANYGDAINERGLYYVVGIRTPNIFEIRDYYFGSPQLEKKI